MGGCKIVNDFLYLSPDGMNFLTEEASRKENSPDGNYYTIYKTRWGNKKYIVAKARGGEVITKIFRTKIGAEKWVEEE